MKKFFALALAAMMAASLAGCSSGVSQEEYDAVVAERDSLVAKNNTLTSQNNSLEEELELYRPSEAFDKASDELDSMYPNMVLSEVSYEKYKILQINSILSTSDVLSNDDAYAQSEELGRKMASLVAEDWFDYDYVCIDILVYGYGRISSIIMDCATLQVQSTMYVLME